MATLFYLPGHAGGSDEQHLPAAGGGTVSLRGIVWVAIPIGILGGPYLGASSL